MTKLTIDQRKKFLEKMIIQREEFLKENPTYIPMTNAPFYSNCVATFVPILKDRKNAKTND